MKRLMLVVPSLLLMACGGSGEPVLGTSISTDEGGKELFSKWENRADDESLDLTGGRLNTRLNFYITEAEGATCYCDLTFLGDVESGSYVLNQCTYIENSSDADPGCNNYNHAGTYDLSNSILTMCDDAEECTEYE